MLNIVYTEFIKKLAMQTLNVHTSPLRVILLSSEYNPNPSHKKYNELVGYEVNGNGYVAGGKLLESVEMNSDEVDSIIKITADPVTWENSSLNVRYAAIYEESTGTLIACFDFEEIKTSLNGNFTVEWPVEGFVQIGGAHSSYSGGANPFMSLGEEG